MDRDTYLENVLDALALGPVLIVSRWDIGRDIPDVRVETIRTTRVRLIGLPRLSNDWLKCA